MYRVLCAQSLRKYGQREYLCTRECCSGKKQAKFENPISRPRKNILEGQDVQQGTQSRVTNFQKKIWHSCVKCANKIH